MVAQLLGIYRVFFFRRGLGVYGSMKFMNKTFKSCDNMPYKETNFYGMKHFGES